MRSGFGVIMAGLLQRFAAVLNKQKEKGKKPC